MTKPRYCFVIPIFNEQQIIPELYKRLSELLDRLDGPADVIFIDDGSRDNSYPLLIEISAGDPRFKLIHFSRNFGHQIAISAGLDFSSADATIIMDADLQDPPQVVLQMIDQWKEGYEIVYGKRESREGETFFKRITASLFYRIIHALSEVEMPLDSGDFRLVDRKALAAFKALREKNRFVRGMFSWIGYRQTEVRYARDKRLAGETKYPLRKMLRLAKDGIISFSNIPLTFVLNLGFLLSGASLLYGVVAIFLKAFGFYTVRGWASEVAVICFLGGTQLVVLGIIGEYVGRIYSEVKNRPLYIVKETHGFSTTQKAPSLSPEMTSLSPDKDLDLPYH